MCKVPRARNFRIWTFKKYRRCVSPQWSHSGKAQIASVYPIHKCWNTSSCVVVSLSTRRLFSFHHFISFHFISSHTFRLLANSEVGATRRGSTSNRLGKTCTRSRDSQKMPLFGHFWFYFCATIGIESNCSHHKFALTNASLLHFRATKKCNMAVGRSWLSSYRLLLVQLLRRVQDAQEKLIMQLAQSSVCVCTMNLNMLEWA